MKNKSATQQHEMVKPEDMAIDGLLHEFGSNDTASHQGLIDRIMTEAQQLSNTPELTVSRTTAVISIIKYLLPAAACLAIIGVVILKNGGTSTDKVKSTSDSPCLIASTPGGIIDRAGTALAISNGMKINRLDQIKTYASSVAYLQFNDLSRLEISGNSKLDYDGTKVIRQPDNSQIKKIAISLHEGAIYGNIVKTHNYGAFTVKTPQGKLTIRQGKFILVNKPGSLYLEVISGAVYFKAIDQAKVIKLKPKQICLIGTAHRLKITSLQRIDSSAMKQQIIASRQRLTMNKNSFEQLLLKLYKKKKADICFRRNKLKNRKIFL